jgi:hypothetical protein
MNLQQLLKIKSEVDIFQQDLNEAIKLAKDTPGYKPSWANGDWVGKNEISGTHVNGQLRRSYLTLKYKLTRLFYGN